MSGFEFYDDKRKTNLENMELTSRLLRRSGETLIFWKSRPIPAMNAGSLS